MSQCTDPNCQHCLDYATAVAKTRPMRVDMKVERKLMVSKELLELARDGDILSIGNRARERYRFVNEKLMKVVYAADGRKEQRQRSLVMKRKGR